LLGLEGSIRYNENGDAQYTETEMYRLILGLMPKLLVYRQLYKRGVDVIVTHSPPRHIHDKEDYSHRGFKAFRWLIKWARPRYFLHGHIDVYDNRQPRETLFHNTQVVNVNPSRVITLE
jgi:Icc-related predicted phosphoesterase